MGSVTQLVDWVKAQRERGSATHRLLQKTLTQKSQTAHGTIVEACVYSAVVGAGLDVCKAFLPRTAFAVKHPLRAVVLGAAIFLCFRLSLMPPLQRWLAEPLPVPAASGEVNGAHHHHHPPRDGFDVQSPVPVVVVEQLPPGTAGANGSGVTAHGT